MAAIRRHANVLAIVAVALVIEGAGLFWQAHETNVNQAARQREGLVIERKLCQTFAQLAANQPPPGKAADNPSRAYEQRNHAILGQLPADIGLNCNRKDKP